MYTVLVCINSIYVMYMQYIYIMFSHSHVNIPMYSLSQSPRLRLDVADRFPPAVLSAFAQLVGGSTRGELAKMLGFLWFFILKKCWV